MTNRITAITPQKKNSRRFNIFIDGEYAFSIAADLALPLSPGDPLSEGRIDELKKADETQRAFEKALFYLRFRPRSKTEIIRYLEKKEFDSRAIEETLKRLEHYQYIDDASFAAFWVESRKNHRPKGLFALRFELREKGIDEAIIERALMPYDEPDAAWRAVSTKLGGWRNLPRMELKVKIYNFLKRRGFSFETCEAVFTKAYEMTDDPFGR